MVHAVKVVPSRMVGPHRGGRTLEEEMFDLVVEHRLPDVSPYDRPVAVEDGEGSVGKGWCCLGLKKSGDARVGEDRHVPRDMLFVFKKIRRMAWKSKRCNSAVKKVYCMMIVTAPGKSAPHSLGRILCS